MTLTTEDFRTIETINASDTDMRTLARQAAASELRDLENLYEEQRTSVEDERIAELREFLASN